MHTVTRQSALIGVGVFVTACMSEPTALDAGPDLSHVARGGASVDQSQPTVDAAAAFTWAVGGAFEQKLAQIFTPGVSGKLWEVELPVACASGELVLEIRDVAAGLPGTVVLSSHTYRPEALTRFTPSVATFSVLRVRPAPTLAMGTAYAIVLDNPTGSCGVLPGPVGDPYGGGDGFSRDLVNVNWVPLLDNNGNYRNDLPFFTYMK